MGTSNLKSEVDRIRDIVSNNDIQIVDFKFSDLFGLWQHFSMPIAEIMDVDDLESSVWVDGFGFDGSSIRGFQEITESDMILIADPLTAQVDPICGVPTLSVTCNIFDPLTRDPYSRDPRYIAMKAESYLKSSGIADTSYWGPELEHFIFDDVRYGQNEHSGYFYVDSEEGIWNTGSDEDPNLGYKIPHKGGYSPVPPHDTLQDLRSEIILAMAEVGIEVEVHHHEVASAGQGEIDMRYDTLTSMADQVMWQKYLVKNIARQYGKVATFMPKPIFNDNGSGMHVHSSLWKGDKNLFYDKDGYALTSETARYYTGGLLKHARSLMAFCAPTTNSYKRLVPGYEAPVNLVYSARNRSAAVRIPMYTGSPKGKRLEFRSPDPTANPYLAFSALLMAGLDGIANKIDPGEPFDKNTYDLTDKEKASLQTVPGSLAEAIDALEEDHEYLLQGDVFTKDLLDVWIDEKRNKEIFEMNLRPHPWEFNLYFDA